MDFDADVNKIGRRRALAFFAKRLAALLVLASLALGVWHGCGWHFAHEPTADELYGCTVEQAAPNGECQ